jgi:predicted ArsR family transcriptional regulator
MRFFAFFHLASNSLFGKSAKARQAVEELSMHMSEWYDDMKKNGYALVPIKNLVGLQVACNFATAEYVRDRRARYNFLLHHCPILQVRQNPPS